MEIRPNANYILYTHSLDGSTYPTMQK